MIKDKILFVGGTWDLEKGQTSNLVSKFASYLENVELYNGGNYYELNNLISKVKDYNIVFWWPNVSNNLPKIRNVKEINNKIMLVTSKNNSSNKYSFQELLKRSLLSKSNLVVEFVKINNTYKMRLFDPLGNVYYDDFEIEKCAQVLIKRLKYIKSLTREPTISDKDNKILLEDFIKLKELIKKEDSVVLEKKKFIELVKEHSLKVSNASDETKDVKKFMGNASFRTNNYIVISKRDVNKERISIEDFIPIYIKNNNIYYLGDTKPSKDSPIQTRLYNLLSNINYIIHSHCYIEGAPYTESLLPCGALEEIDEILKTIKKNYETLNEDYYAINLLGHGSIIMSSNIDKISNIKIVARKLPEIQN